MKVLAESVRRGGFAGPFPLPTPAACRLLVDHVRFGPPPAIYLVFEVQAARPAPAPDAPPPESERDRLARELRIVLTSSSWRITAPLRRAAAALRR